MPMYRTVLMKKCDIQRTTSVMNNVGRQSNDDTRVVLFLC